MSECEQEGSRGVKGLKQEREKEVLRRWRAAGGARKGLGWVLILGLTVTNVWFVSLEIHCDDVQMQNHKNCVTVDSL